MRRTPFLVSELVQQIAAVHNGAVQVGPDGFFYVHHIGNERLDSSLFDALVGSPAHSAAEKDIAVSDGFCHRGVPFPASGPKAVSASLVYKPLLMRKLPMPHLVAHLTLDDLAIFNGEDFTRAQFQAVTPVPLPAAIWLFGSGLLGLIGVSRRKRPA